MGRKTQFCKRNSITNQQTMAPASVEARFNANATSIAKGKSQINSASLLMNTVFHLVKK